MTMKTDERIRAVYHTPSDAPREVAALLQELRDRWGQEYVVGVPWRRMLSDVEAILAGGSVAAPKEANALDLEPIRAILAETDSAYETCGFDCKFHPTVECAATAIRLLVAEVERLRAGLPSSERRALAVYGLQFNRGQPAMFPVGTLDDEAAEDAPAHYVKADDLLAALAGLGPASPQEQTRNKE